MSTYSSDSSLVKSTYSHTSSHDNQLKAQELIDNARKEELRRQQHFEKLTRTVQELFEIPGLTFYCFGQWRIKFSFKPAELVKYVSKKVKFYVTLVYTKNHWKIKHDTIPANYKKKIYALFYKSTPINDTNIVECILNIYEILEIWAHKHQQFRLDKFKRYTIDKDIILDSDDEELFLTQQEIDELHKKRWKVLKRMIPPKTGF